MHEGERGLAVGAQAKICISFQLTQYTAAREKIHNLYFRIEIGLNNSREPVIAFNNYSQNMSDCLILSPKELPEVSGFTYNCASLGKDPEIVGN